MYLFVYVLWLLWGLPLITISYFVSQRRDDRVCVVFYSCSDSTHR